jgi:hypothetical protein
MTREEMLKMFPLLVWYGALESRREDPRFSLAEFAKLVAAIESDMDELAQKKAKANALKIELELKGD